MGKIIIKDEHIMDAKTSGCSVVSVLTKAYEGEIADRIAKDSRLKDFDAFQLAMMDAGISKSSKIKDFYATSENEWLFPVFIDRTLTENVNKNDILRYIVSGSPIMIDSMSATGSYVDLINDENNKDATKKKRVVEGSELPKATIKLGTTAIALSKYGRAVEATYESIQYSSVDLFAKQLAWIAADVSNQEFENALGVLIDGDGNNNAAPITTAASGTITADDILSLALALWKDCHVALTTIIAPEPLYKAMNKMVIKESDKIGYIPGTAFNFPQGITSDITVILGDVPTGGSGKQQLVGLNSDFALTKYIANGSQISEYGSDILKQKKLGTISEIAAFTKPFKNSSRILRMA